MTQTTTGRRLPERPNPGEMIRNLCRAVIEQLDEENAVVIVAKDVARRVFKKLDPSHRTVAVVQSAALEGIAQMARGCLRERHDLPDQKSSEETIDAFARELSERYVIKRAEFEEPGYVKREDTTPDEIDEQVMPMLARGRDAFQSHMDLLGAWNRKRRS